MKTRKRDFVHFFLFVVLFLLPRRGRTSTELSKFMFKGQLGMFTAAIPEKRCFKLNFNSFYKDLHPRQACKQRISPWQLQLTEMLCH